MGSNLDIKLIKMEQATSLFIIFQIEFANKDTGEVVTLTTTCGSYKELGKYLTDMEKKQWKMLTVTRTKG